MYLASFLTVVFDWSDSF